MSKQQIIQMLEKMPDDLSDLEILAEIEDFIMIKQALKKSREDIKNGRVFSHEEVFEKYKKYLD